MIDKKFYEDIRKKSAGYLFLHAGGRKDITQKGGKAVADTERKISK